jgi:lipopolysaccharide/colanic/teichoic acid biosynthesis glycosyltransferase
VGKRVFDVIVSIICLIVLFPLFTVIAIIIKTSDFGPVFYSAKRVGRNGNIFLMYKFRSMIVNAEKVGPSSAALSDARITPVGRFLRKYKIDELPQLINVLMGEMSIVGPRPEENKFTDLYSDEEKSILTLKPGITDWASIWNSNEAEILENSEDPDKTYMEIIRPEKIRLQLVYVKNHNFFIDLKIIFLTIHKLLGGKTV